MLSYFGGLFLILVQYSFFCNQGTNLASLLMGVLEVVQYRTVCIGIRVYI